MMRRQMANPLRRKAAVGPKVDPTNPAGDETEHVDGRSLKGRPGIGLIRNLWGLIVGFEVGWTKTVKIGGPSKARKQYNAMVRAQRDCNPRIRKLLESRKENPK